MAGRKTTYKIPVAVLERLDHLTGRARREHRHELLRVRLLETAIDGLSPDHPALATRPPRTPSKLMPANLPEDLLWKVTDIAHDGVVRLDLSDVITVGLTDVLDQVERALNRLKQRAG